MHLLGFSLKHLPGTRASAVMTNNATESLRARLKDRDLLGRGSFEHGEGGFSA